MGRIGRCPAVPGMWMGSVMKNIKILDLVLRVYSFKGRVTRTEYWVTTGIQWGLIYLIGSFSQNVRKPDGTFADIGEFLFILVFWLILISNLSMGWRRMQDRGKAGWLYLQPLFFTLVAYALLIGGAMALLSSTDNTADVEPTLIAVGYVIYAAIGIATTISWIIALISLCKASQPGPNKYGPNPLEVPQ